MASGPCGQQKWDRLLAGPEAIEYGCRDCVGPTVELREGQLAGACPHGDAVGGVRHDGLEPIRNRLIDVIRAKRDRHGSGRVGP